MKPVTFISGNEKKGEVLRRYLGFDINQEKIDLKEIQTLNLDMLITEKVREAYSHLGSPVLVEDISLEFREFGRLPGPFIRFYLEEIGLTGLTELLGDRPRDATARCHYAYYDGSSLEIFRGALMGTVSELPRGTGGFGWDSIFIPHWSTLTCAEMDDLGYERFTLDLKPIEALRDFLKI